MSAAVDFDAQSDSASLLSSATTCDSSYLSSPPSISTGSDWDDMIPPPRVRLDETEQIFVYQPAPGVIREERHRKRRRQITVRRTRKGHTHLYEKGLSASSWPSLP